jgi:hypothetical protein
VILTSQLEKQGENEHDRRTAVAETATKPEALDLVLVDPMS